MQAFRHKRLCIVWTWFFGVWAAFKVSSCQLHNHEVMIMSIFAEIVFTTWFQDVHVIEAKPAV
jgi:hypothetical protein